MSKVFVGLLLGTIIGLIGSFALMLAMASLLDSIFGGPGYGAMVFCLSFVLSPVAGVVGGLLGARIAREQAPSDTHQKAAAEAAGPK